MHETIFEENLALNRSEIEQRRSTLSSRVTSLVVTLTTKCNIRCLMCEEYRIPWDMPQRTLDEIVALFPYLEQVIWQGGETLILDYFTDGLLAEAKKYPKMHQSIITNGLPIDEKMADKLVMDNMELTFSIDGITQESYENIRRGASFDRLKRNIRLINEVRRRKQPKDMTVRMHTIIMNSSYRELVRFVDFAKEFEFDALHLMPVWGNIEGPENIFHHNNEEALNSIKANIGQAERKAREYGLNLLNSLPFSETRGQQPASCAPGPGENSEKPSGKNDGRLFCLMPWKRMVINPAGMVSPACHCGRIIGNVLDYSLADLWNNDLMVFYRESILAGTYQRLCSKACVEGHIADELRGLK